jgi:hypothetical protein
VSDVLDRVALRHAFAVTRGVLQEAEGEGRAAPGEMAIAILRLLEFAVANGRALNILAKEFAACLVYLKSQVPIEAWEPLRVAFHHNKHGAMEAKEAGA